MRSVLIFLSIFLFIGSFAWFVWPGGYSDSPEAAILQAVSEDQPMPTVFPEPSPIIWAGQVTRTLTGGRGIEVRSVDALGGWFFAYRADDSVLGEIESSVEVTGLWRGISCEYGRCAPEVEIQTMAVHPINLE